MNRFLASRILRVLPSLKSVEGTAVKYSVAAFSRSYSAAAAVAKPDAVPEPPISVSVATGADKDFDPKLVKIVDQISKLNLIEVSELNTLLKKTLNISDAPMMPMMAMQAAAPAEEEVVAQPQQVQSSFTLKLLKFDETKKVALIKEVKNLLEGMNLVQAKKFVESAPTVVKADIPKDEVEKLQAALQAVGATCEVV